MRITIGESCRNGSNRRKNLSPQKINLHEIHSLDFSMRFRTRVNGCCQLLIQYGQDEIFSQLFVRFLVRGGKSFDTLYRQILIHF